MNLNNLPSSPKKEAQEPTPNRILFSNSFLDKNKHQVPEINLPKGGGGLKGIDEKFEINPVNGTNSIRIPLPISPARSNFSPNLAIQYNSGQGNGTFGLGWNLELPSIRRRTDQKLPQYEDGRESDIFILSGMEDLVPKLKQNAGTGLWEKVERSTASYVIKEYRPRIEGSWQRIERWTDLGTGIIHWRTISTTNVVTVYGDTVNSRIENPERASGSGIFEWLVSYSYDNLGNLIVYEYKAEDLVNVSASIYEKNRDLGTVTNRYLKRVHYGNKSPYKHGDNLPAANDFLFETVLDYGEHEIGMPKPSEDASLSWEARKDAFSSFRSGFDIRTYRLCQRVLLFHKFNNDQPIGELLVSSMELKYGAEPTDSTTNSIEGFTYLKAVHRKGYLYDGGIYKTKPLPPLTFSYQEHAWNTNVKKIDSDSLEGAPTGINNSGYNWTDLYGEGISGILVEEQQGWYYKENLGGGLFKKPELLREKPSFNGVGIGMVQFQDLEGNGERQLVSLGQSPKGYFSFEEGTSWNSFQSFESIPNRDLLNDPNVRFVDLDGNGRADLLITEQDIFQWHGSEGKAGYGAANRIELPLKEEDGPRVVFADNVQSIFLADMTGDGMTDIVRIKNGVLCYWANKGYGYFSKKISMSNAPQMEHEELFNPRYLKLADIDGSGTTDIVYILKDKILIWMNQSGNFFTQSPQIIQPFPEMDGGGRMDVIDLLGTGTACLVWSSMGIKNRNEPLRYIDLMDSKKPHLLYKYENNVGAEVRFDYRSSTHYYLEDKKSGKPWATKLPFPVHVVSKVSVTDFIRNTVLTNQYSYHHGYYDMLEREFRGFGRVEQLDIENFNVLTAAIDPEHYQMPIKTISWYHTGASFRNRELTKAYEIEYYENVGIEESLGGIQLPANLPDSLYHEAYRACKGQLLRQEVYSLDVDNPKHKDPYSTSESGYRIQVIQPKNEGPYGSFVLIAEQSMTYTYERNRTDPRIRQELVIEVDELGIPLETATIIYPRIGGTSVPTLVRTEQSKLHVIYKTKNLTNDVDLIDAYRLRIAYEEQMYELLGLTWLPNTGASYFRIETIRTAFQTIHPVLSYEEEYNANLGGVQKRLSAHVKEAFLSDNLRTVLGFGQQESLGIAYRSYELAYTETLRGALYKIGSNTNLLSSDVINGQSAQLDLAQTSGYVDLEGNGDWWMPSGTTVYPNLPSNASATTPNPAVDNFYLPVGMSDALGTVTKLFFDAYELYTIKIVDALENEIEWIYDYRTLSPKSMLDANKNESVVVFDELGIVIQSILRGKAGEGDTLANPTAWMDYNLFNWKDNGKPNFIHRTVREEHYQADPNNTKIQEYYEYSDGSGGVIMTKSQTKDGLAKDWLNGSFTLVDTSLDPLLNRWIGSGRMILDNKGNPIKEYEPYFSTSYEYEEEEALVQEGVTPILYYDAAGRNVRTVFPNGTFMKIVYDAWQLSEYDANDTILESEWYQYLLQNHATILNGTTMPNDPELRSAWLSKAHKDTPKNSYLDCLGRAIYTEHDDGIKKRAIYTKTDLAERYTLIYDELSTEELEQSGTTTRGESSYELTNMLGQQVYKKLAVKGEQWLFADVLDRLVRVWDNPDNAAVQLRFRTTYDALNRPLKTFVEQGINPEICFAKTVYGESVTPQNSIWSSQSAIEAANLRGQVYERYDQSGKITNLGFDFKGNLLAAQRQLVRDYVHRINWNLQPVFEIDTFRTSTTYDALDRPKETTLADGTILESSYNKGAYLETLKAIINGVSYDFMKEQRHNAKGQREQVRYGNNTITQYLYDAKTFRLSNLLTFQTANSGSNLQELYYTYDPVGNILEVEDKAQQSFYFQNTVVQPKKEYVYDALYRLIESKGREHASNLATSRNDLVQLGGIPHQNSISAVRRYRENYKYDEVGNLLEVNHSTSSTNATGSWTRRYNYGNNATNQLLTTNVVTGGNTNTYTYSDYDVHGNMKKMPHLQALHWDFQDQLVQVDLNTTGDQAYYNYNENGQRIRKVVVKSGERSERLYLGGLERYREYSANGTIKLERWTIQIEDIAQVDALTVDNSVVIAAPQGLIRYQYRDHLGSASMEMNELAQVISYEEYHPYGTSSYRVAQSGTNLSLKRYRFTNKERDEETGLYYFGVRYYAGWLGRWTSSDPGNFVDGLNLYVYVRNNPVVLVDVKGYAGEPPPEDANKIINNDTGDNVTYGSNEDEELVKSISQEKAPTKWYEDTPINQRKKRVGKPKPGSYRKNPNYNPTIAKKIEEWQTSGNVKVHFTSNKEEMPNKHRINGSGSLSKRGDRYYIYFSLDKKVNKESGTTPLLEEVFHLLDVLEGENLWFNEGNRMEGLDIYDEVRAKKKVIETTPYLNKTFEGYSGGESYDIPTHFGAISKYNGNEKKIAHFLYTRTDFYPTSKSDGLSRIRVIRGGSYKVDKHPNEHITKDKSK